MKIKSLHISAFGGLKNLDLSFDDSFNVIYGENEHGKTTIMNFIKMMFYGTERSTAALSKNLRKKYLPWDNSQMAGSIDFENNGKNYKIERIFGNSNSTDKVTLIDLGFGTRETVAADIGTSLFGLSAAAFERSIFIGQFGFPESNDLAAGELNGKLSNIALTGDEAISYDAVKKRLETAKYELMSKSGRSGVYDKNAKLLKELETELEVSLSNEQTINTAKQKAKLMAEEITTLQKQLAEIKVKIDSENDVRNSEKLKELLNLKKQLDILNKSLTLSDGKLADEMFVRKVEFCLSKIETYKAKIDTKQNEIKLLQSNLNLALNPSANATPEKLEELNQNIKNIENQIAQTTESRENLSTKPKQKPNVLWYILTGVFAVVGVAIFALEISQILAIACFAVALIFICIGIITSSKAKQINAKTESEIVDLKLKENQLISLLATEKANFTAINTALNTNSAMIENQKQKIDQTTEENSILNQEIEKEQTTLFALFKTFNETQNIEEIKTALLEIKQKAETQKSLKQNINYILKDIGNISYEQAEEKLQNMAVDTDIDFEQLKTDGEALANVITTKRETLATLLAEIKTLTANTKNAEQIKTQINSLKASMDTQKDYCDALDTALSVLDSAYSEVRQSYGSVLEQNASEIFKAITDNRYNNMSISKSFDITVEKTDIFGSRELDYLSSGTADQAYLCLRLALSNLLTETNEKLPIILDDALAQYDDNRTKTALKFLKEYSQNGQILIFTCHKSLCDSAKELSANQITL